jgi:hypothetical protein
MNSLTEIKRRLIEQDAYLAETYGVAIVGVFGSYVRGEQNPSSDVDLLIEVSETSHIDLLDLVRLEDYLSELLEINVDITIKRNLRKRIGRRILGEVVSL